MARCLRALAGAGVIVVVLALALLARADDPRPGARSSTTANATITEPSSEPPRNQRRKERRRTEPPREEPPPEPAPSGTIETSTQTKEALARSPVSYRRTTLFFVADSATRPHATRARLASSALKNALESDPVELGAPRVDIKDAATATAALYVRGHFITTLHPADAAANDKPSLSDYAQELAEGLDLFVADQTRRATLQDFALRAFLAVFIAVAGLLAIRALRYVFSRADDMLDDRRVFFRPITILQVPIISSETLGAALAFALAIGRVAAYVLVGAVTIALVFAQFGPTSSLVDAIVAWGSVPLLRAFEGFVGAIPGIFLALGLVVALKGALRVIRVLLDGVSTGRAHLPGVTADRVPVLRTIMPLIVVLLVSPLIVAAVFGRYDTPIEEVLLATATTVVLACVPLLSSAVVGLGVLWRGAVKPGDWIDSGHVSGLVRSVTAWEIVVETKNGARASIPMLSLVFRPVNTQKAPPQRNLEVLLRRAKSAREVVDTVQRVVEGVQHGASCAIIGFSTDAVRLRIDLPTAAASDEHGVLLALHEAGERGELQLIEASTSSDRT